ncbi:MAG: DUF1700 domain-containing protein [Clostridium sp.]|nr:DUF1700 domain-containing protein [Acetatifactor muris]MCM1526858.1 DUF1700 domain-containing protein [Bacteroides sp.]MCM1562942.1 DUF1700 domain-containing protein [Clostridium sp.]
MNKQEFVDRLRAALTGRIPASQVEENVNYYMDYINTEIRKGRSEEEVLQSLGDPRLIARTIIQTSGASGIEYSAGYQGESYGTESGRHRSFRIPGWLFVLLIFLVIVLIIGIVFSILSALWPFILMTVAIVLLVKLFRDWLN